MPKKRNPPGYNWKQIEKWVNREGDRWETESYYSIGKELGMDYRHVYKYLPQIVGQKLGCTEEEVRDRKRKTGKEFPQRTPPEIKARVVALGKQGLIIRDIAARVHRATATVRRILKRCETSADVKRPEPLTVAEPESPTDEPESPTVTESESLATESEPPSVAGPESPVTDEVEISEPESSDLAPPEPVIQPAEEYWSYADDGYTDPNMRHAIEQMVLGDSRAMQQNFRHRPKHSFLDIVNELKMHPHAVLKCLEDAEYVSGRLDELIQEGNQIIVNRPEGLPR